MLVVPAGESGVQSVADLRGKTLALPRGTRETARLFLERQTAHDGQTPEQFFGKVLDQTTTLEKLTVNGQPVTLDADQQGTYTPTSPGRYIVGATAMDADGQIGTTTAAPSTR